ncbi:Leupeptin-inactivating enzyme 1 [bacterium HR33]|nr:Leupeptin-inactivating enzyme 1 [bacterium HR33]
MRWSSVSALVAAIFSAPALAACQNRAPVSAAVSSITEADVARRVAILAHDSMRGRSTLRPEIETVASYIASEFRRLGLKPGGDGGDFIQRYSVERVRLDPVASSISVAGSTTWRFGTDVLYPPFLPVADMDRSARLAIISGIPDTAAPPEVKDRALLVVLPAGIDNALADIDRILFSWSRAGAVAVMIPVSLADSSWRRMAERQDQFRTQRSWDGGEIPLLWVREQAAAKLLAAQGIDLASLARARHKAQAVATPLDVSIKIRRQVASSLSPPNVVGILEGSDPQLKNEYMVFSAHMDHVGVGRPDATGDTIYNGADDNASGTTAILELAEAFSLLAPRPKRSLIFLTVSGEEMGLWGSDYFTSNPPVPLSQLVADLNADMIGRNWKDTIVVIGKEHSDLGQTLARVSARHPELRMAPIDDLWPEERFFFRSDHFNFARRGVPALFFFNGVHGDYHRPGDEAHKIDAEKASRVIKLIFYLGLEIANAPSRPRWNPESYRVIVQRAER